jgi:Ca2+:H+ antiporter
MFAVIVAFVIPEVFSFDMDAGETLGLSIGISIILMALYLAALFFKLVTHRGVYQPSEGGESHHEEEPEWSKGKALLILALATVAVATFLKTLCIPLKPSRTNLAGRSSLSGSSSLRL